MLLTVAACSPSGTSTVESSRPADGNLSTSPGKALTISPSQLLAATHGVTPVAFGKPAHGSITYGAYGAMIYTPDAGFGGTDSLPVTVSPAVRLYAEDETPRIIIGDVAIQPNAHGSAIAQVPGKTDEIYGLSDRGPNVDGRTRNEKVLPVPDFHPQIARLKLADGVASVQQIITLSGRDGAPLVGLTTRRPSPVRRWSTSTEAPGAVRTAWTVRAWSPCPTAHFGCPTNTARSSSTSMRMAKALTPFAIRRTTAQRTLAAQPKSGHGRADAHPDGSTLVGTM